MKIAHLAEAFNLPVTSHGAHDVTVHLLAACPNRSYLEAHGFELNATLRSLCGSMRVVQSRPAVRVTASSSTGKVSERMKA